MAKDSLRFLGDEYGNTVNWTCDILDKAQSTYNYLQYMLDRTIKMFRYSGLPDTIPEPMLEYMLQVYGSVAIIEHNGDIYAMRAEFGGPPDPYYRPSIAIVANPALAISNTYRVANHLPPFDRTTWDPYPPCVRFLNDTQIMGLVPLFARYATQMTENDISIRSAQINLRQQSIIAADDGPEIESARNYIKNLESGHMSAIVKRAFVDGIQVEKVSQGSSNVVTQLVELQQYLRASWYNEIGLNSNFNMKRQYLSTEEVESAADIMLPLVDNMFNSRQMALDAINKQFGTNIMVEKDSAWEKKQIQSDLGIQLNPETGELLPAAEDGVEEDEVAEEEREEQQDDTGEDENDKPE